MTIDPNCWVELKGAAPARGPRVFAGVGTVTGNVAPAPALSPPVEGDIFVSTNGLGSFVYDQYSTWQPLGSPKESTYFGHGYGPAALPRFQAGAGATPPPVAGEAIVVDQGTGQLEIFVWDGTAWSDPVNPVMPGDDYTDVDTGNVYELQP